MGKKLAIGCLIVFVLLFLGGAGVAWWFIGRPAGELIGSVRDMQRIESIRDNVRASGPYDAPQDGVLAERQVERYMAVQETMRTRLEDRVATLRDRYEEIDERGGDPTPAEIARAWSDVTGILVEAVEAQVDALNEQNFSLEEYDWVRARVLAAAGFAAGGYDLTDLTSGEAPDRAVPSEERVEVPDENVELVEPHVERIEETLPFAWFGL